MELCFELVSNFAFPGNASASTSPSCARSSADWLRSRERTRASPRSMRRGSGNRKVRSRDQSRESVSCVEDDDTWPKGHHMGHDSRCANDHMGRGGCSSQFRTFRKQSKKWKTSSLSFTPSQSNIHMLSRQLTHIKHMVYCASGFVYI